MAIPKRIDPAWKQIWNDAVNAHAEWRIHEQLFNKGPKRMKLLDHCASNFFALFQDAVLLSIQLRLSKLGDPAQSKSFDNLTLAKLRDEIKQHDPEPDPKKVQAFQERLSECLQEFGTKSAKIRERRNKFLAHSDYETALNRRPIPILTPTRLEIHQALDALKNFMREVETYFDLPITSYGNVNTVNDGETVIYWLKRGIRYKELTNDNTLPYRDLDNSEWAKA